MYNAHTEHTIQTIKQQRANPLRFLVLMIAAIAAAAAAFVAIFSRSLLCCSMNFLQCGDGYGNVNGNHLLKISFMHTLIFNKKYL